MQGTHFIKCTLWIATRLFVTGMILKGFFGISFSKQPLKDQASLEEYEEAAVSGMRQALGFPPPWSMVKV